MKQHSKPNRRVVVLNNDKEHAHVAKIKGLYDKNGKRRKNVIPIENYNFLTKPSGVEKRVHKTTGGGRAIRVSLMGKSKGRLNKWDMKNVKKIK